ncbi:MAG: hypothetical protein HPY58_12740 [Firmicutes bacterium]|nr:hypothetical protein [Bacillota bacterium]
MMQVFIDGVDRTSIVDLRTLRVSDAIGERSTAGFLVNDLDNTLGPVLQPGEVVEIVHDGSKVFAGTIDRAVQLKVAQGAMQRQYQVDCVDWHQIADRRIVAETYENTPAGSIVADLVSKYLAGEGISCGPDSVQEGPIVVEAVFNYVPATTALDKLAELAGFSWWIDPEKILHFVERATYAAPWVLDSPLKFRELQIERSREGYRNRQYIRAGKDITDPQVEQFKGDGASRTWTVGFPIARVPTVKVNGVVKTVGIKGIDEGKDFYWNKGDPVLTQDSSGSVLTASDTLEVTYQGFFDVVVLVDDYAAIEERKGVEGGTGYYEAVEDEPYLSSREAAIRSGNAKLRKYAKLMKRISFRTYQGGLRPGQILTVNLPDRGLVAEDFLVEAVDLSEESPGVWLYSVRAISGEAVGGWTKFFKNMASRGQAFVIRENIREYQVLIRLVQSQEGWQWAEQMPVTVFACPIPSSSLYPSPTLYPC